jgi:putative ATPase
MRPRSLDEVVGQDGLVGPGAPLRVLVESGHLPSLILWGPPGSGKTTLARLLAAGEKTDLVALSAVQAGVKEVREAVERARRNRTVGRRTVLFLDEIHRFNRAQQDALLPHVEDGTLVLVGATTENPSFEVVSPLLSRCRVFTVKPLGADDLLALLRRAAADAVRGVAASGCAVGEDALRAIAEAADGDARRALGWLEAAVDLARGQGPVTAETVRRVAGRRLLLHDRDREEHYNVVSALIKSLRASDPDAALYWLARMLAAGEDPLFVARRLVIFAAEDVGNAEPVALSLATSAFLAVERVGMPEGRIPLAQATTFLACAPKSNASYAALGRAEEAVAAHGTLPVPMHLRNAPTGLMKGLGYGRGYRYAHDAPDAFVPDANLPAELADAVWYQPTQRGAEAAIAERLATWRRRRREAQERGAKGSADEDPEPACALAHRRRLLVPFVVPPLGGTGSLVPRCRTRGRPRSQPRFDPLRSDPVGGFFITKRCSSTSASRSKALSTPTTLPSSVTTTRWIWWLRMMRAATWTSS